MIKHGISRENRHNKLYNGILGYCLTLYGPQLPYGNKMGVLGGEAPWRFPRGEREILEGKMKEKGCGFLTVVKWCPGDT